MRCKEISYNVGKVTKRVVKNLENDGTRIIYGDLPKISSIATQLINSHESRDLDEIIPETEKRFCEFYLE